MSFENRRITDILPSLKSIPSVGLQNTVSELLDKLVLYQTNAALVKTSDETVYGFVDVLDLCTWLCSTLETPILSTSKGESRSIISDDEESIERRTQLFKSQVISNIVAISRRNFYQKLSENSLINEAIDLFKKGCHRIAVTSSVDNSVIGVLSQSDLLSWACNNPSFLSTKSSTPISDLHCKKCDHLYTISKNSKAHEAFLLMNQKKISSLPALRGQDLSILLNSVGDFISKIREATGKPTYHTVCCSPDMTVLQAIQSMCKENVHRVFMCNESCSPACVISMTDVFDHLRRNTQHHHH